MDPSEAKFLASLRAGDSMAYEQLVRENGGRMLQVAHRFLSNEEDAHDAVQEAFLSAFRALDRFEGGARISTWLHRILVNACLMKLRTRRRHPEMAFEDLLPKFLDDGHQIDPAVEWRDPPESGAERDEIKILVRSHIDRLPEVYRTVLLLRDMEELDTAQTANLLGLTENAVKIRLHRARQALRTLLDPHFRSFEAV